MNKIAFLLIACLAAAWPSAQSHAQVAAPELRVATRMLAPMVVEQNGVLTGFSIDVWNAIAERLKLKIKFQMAPDISTLLSDVSTGKADLGVAAISITSAREEQFDFSQPILNAGLQIMVRGGSREAGGNPLADLFSLLFSSTALIWLGIALLLVLIPAHVVWYYERDQKDGIVPTREYFPGILYGLYWAAGTLATQAEQAPKHWLGRVVAVLWMFTGVVFVALYTAQLTATLTVQQIAGSIKGPDDLAGKIVATTRGSTASVAANGFKASVVEVAKIEDAYQMLHDKKVDAVVFDSPVLLYYVANQGKGRAATVGSPFQKEDYGIVFPSRSPLRSSVNVALLKMREDGTYQRIYDKWFAVK